MKDIVIIGAGGFAREVVWLIEENNKIKPEWNILGYISNETGKVGNYDIVGDDECELPVRFLTQSKLHV